MPQVFITLVMVSEVSDLSAGSIMSACALMLVDPDAKAQHEIANDDEVAFAALARVPLRGNTAGQNTAGGQLCHVPDFRALLSGMLNGAR